MRSIFISYRRADSQLSCDRIYAFLGGVFGVQQVFRDLNAIAGGLDFRRQIERGLGRCKLMLVVIGPQWVTSVDADGRRRLDDPRDPVRLEIETALGRRIPILPLLVQGASIPRAQDLPETLRPLVAQNARPVRPDPDFARDMQTVMQDVAQFVRIPGRGRGWRVARNTARNAVGLLISAITLLLAVAALATWVNVPFVTELVRHWLGK